ncbi:hypothetical protein PybrP1_001069 [[Pythium] brassicae (nom. inval.)]|nr:hypothetical protein PybrP1_001069 [[Pythium] brassicae (nom. inval.)]
MARAQLFRVLLAAIAVLFVGALLVENASTRRQLLRAQQQHSELQLRHQQQALIVNAAAAISSNTNTEERSATELRNAAKLVQNLRHEQSADGSSFETLFSAESAGSRTSAASPAPTVTPTPALAPAPTNASDPLEAAAERLAHEPFPGNHDGSTMHIVFSMSCDQSHRLLYSTVMQESAMRVGQKGPITQILSGCSEDEKALVIAEPRFYYDFRVHFAPSFSPHPLPGVDDNYKAYNKPFGLQHFLRHANPPVQHEIMALVDGDFLFFKPLEVNTGRNMAKYYKGSREPATVTDEVRDGVALAHDWRNVIRGDKFFDGDKSKVVCGEQPCGHVTDDDAWEYYWGLGPPYIMTRNDMNAFVDDYGKLTVAARKVSTDWMTEMYGYSLAAANHGIKHTILSHLGVTHPYLWNSNEYWSFLNADGDHGEVTENPCEHPTRITLPRDPPVSFHFFHLLYAGDAYFYKHRVPEELASCGHELLKVPDAAEWDMASRHDLKDKNDPGARPYRRHEVWASCTLHKAVNRGALLLKQALCGKSGYNAYQGFAILKDKEEK